METLAVDVGSAWVGLCKWEGASLRVRKLPVRPPADAWADWIAALRPSGPCQLLYRCTHTEYDRQTPPARVRRLAERHGARWVRILSDETAADPALASARYFADRRRLGTVAAAEVGARHATLAVVAPGGRPIARERIGLERGALDGPAPVIVALKRLLAHEAGETSAGTQAGAEEGRRRVLVCSGGAGPGMAARLAEAAGLAEVFVPPHAGAAATVGMLMADIVLRFAESLPSVPLDVAALRQGFRRLMDRACEAITFEGCDLDNAECRRYATLALGGESAGLQIPCDDLADEAALVRRFRALGGESTAEAGGLTVRALRVEAVVEPLRPDLPPALAVRGPLADALVADPPRIAGLPEGGRVYDGERIPSDARIDGPAAVRGAHATTRIPPGWRARGLPGGGLMLEPAGLRPS